VKLKSFSSEKFILSRSVVTQARTNLLLYLIRIFLDYSFF